MPANKYALLRYRVIDQCLRNKYKPYPSLEQLQEACAEKIYDDVSISSIEKDLNAMRNESQLGYFAPIKYSRKHKGYYYENEDYSIDDVPLNDTDLEALKLAAHTLMQFKNTSLFKQFDFAIDKLFNRLNLETEEQRSSQQAIVQFEQSETHGNEYLEAIYQAIVQQKKVEFSYLKFQETKASKRILNPYLLKEYRNRWYVIGVEQGQDFVKTFALDRIVAFQETKEPQDSPIDFDAETYFKNTIGIGVSNQKPEKVNLLLSSSAAAYLETQPLHPSQKLVRSANNQHEYEYYVVINYELKSSILSMGSAVQVLNPQHLVDELKLEIQKLGEQYQ